MDNKNSEKTAVGRKFSSSGPLPILEGETLSPLVPERALDEVNMMAYWAWQAKQRQEFVSKWDF